MKRTLICGLAVTLLCAAQPVLAGRTAATADWPRSTPAQAGLQPDTLAQIEARISDRSWPGITSVLVVRHGKLAYERYWQDTDAETRHDLRSATKTLNALLLGAAIERGLIQDVQQPVFGFFPEYATHAHPDPRKQAITLEDLLTMSSLLECNDSNPFSAGNEERMYVSEDWVGFVLDLPIKGFAPWDTRPEDSPHGRSFSYCTAGSFLLGAVIERASGESLAAFSRKVLEAPLGLGELHWNRSPLGVGSGAGGTRMRSRDAARIGELILRKGRWGKRQILPAAWVEAMTTVHAQARDDADYGYQIWRFRFAPEGAETTASTPRYATWAMSGNGGNYVFIQPELDLVVVVTSRAYNQGTAHPQSQALFKTLLRDLAPASAAAKPAAGADR